ncbi:MAG: rRNA (guanine527-N7)-methyltransferase [Acidimicrobiaceae bacterium]
MLERAKRLGFLGPGPVEEHLQHAAAFASAVAAPDLALDLGSGGGIPGLALAVRWPDSRWVLLDANARRTSFLESAVGELGLADRMTVVADRAERSARDDRWRGTFTLVVARSFGPPAVTAECASGFLHVGGRLLVSEPPADDPNRWPPGPLVELGLIDHGRWGQIRVLEQAAPVSERYPRRVGVPAKRPLW